MNNDLEQAEYIDNNGEGLTTWECDFLDSILRTLQLGNTLSAAQRTILNKIEEERVPE